MGLQSQHSSPSERQVMQCPGTLSIAARAVPTRMVPTPVLTVSPLQGDRFVRPVRWRGPRGPPSCRDGSYLVDPASSHMLVSKIKPCMSKYKQSIQ